MTTRLMLYNNALLACGERALSSLSEAVESRRLLDQVWNSGGVQACLEEGQWKFATRSQQVDYDPDIDPGFGYARAFTKPTDYLLTTAMCSDEYYNEPLLQYADEGRHWYSDLDTLYVSYVSNDENYGMDINNWPRWFAEFVEAHFAFKIAAKLAGTEKKIAAMEKLRKMAKLNALNRNMMGDPPRFPPQGNWTRARHQGGTRRDRGNRSGNLY